MVISSEYSYLELCNLGLDATFHSNETDWLKMRKESIGSSDAASVLGLSPWKNEVELWNEKSGRLTINKKNSDIDRGKMSEGLIKSLYAIETGIKVYDGTGIIIRKKEFRNLTCTLDAFKIEDRKVIPIEIKSVLHRSGEWTNDKIPDHYFVQVLHQMLVCDAQRAELLVRFARSEGYDNASERIYHIERDENVDRQIRNLYTAEINFWNVNILNQVKPKLRVPEL